VILRATVADRSWWELAACREVDPNLFYPEVGESTEPAKRVCRGCPVLEQCRQEVLTLNPNRDRDGVVAGLSERERRRLRRRVS
jgi:WhiB family transcriptional regulator, redox-sensing transcriptional regulator